MLRTTLYSAPAASARFIIKTCGDLLVRILNANLNSGHSFGLAGASFVSHAVIT
jgi:hypothetical protein